MPLSQTLEAYARITGDERAKLRKVLVRRYEKGASIRRLAADTGRSYGFIHAILSESDVTLGGRGGSKPGSTKRGFARA